MVVSCSAGKTKAAPNYEAALAASWGDIAEIDILLQAGRVGGIVEQRRDGNRSVSLPCMGETYCIGLADGSVSRGDGAVVGVFTQILILHALCSHTGCIPSGDWIAFSDIPDGLFYGGVYKRRTAGRLARALSGGGDLLWDAAERLGGREAALGGDASAVVEPFAGVPVGIVFWEGDDEFGPAVTFLYDKTITGIFPAEDIVVLTQWLVEEMIQIIREIAR
ncbi:MAG: DUF3786 domain-containing protein [Deltaproteobacteria bacterium]|nr:DUF3786 domain-containing protein [Candidatus Zymogenaceae bacterium]